MAEHEISDDVKTRAQSCGTAETSAKSSGDDALDDFWDIADIVPKRRQYTPAPASRTDPVEIEIPEVKEHTPSVQGGVITGRRDDGTYAPVKNLTSEPECEYEPQNSLIHKIRIWKWHTNYSYYEQFCRTAEYLRDKTAPKTEHVPFFSYMPQYSQLNNQQLSFYLWMRSEIREGRYPDADYSYILLLIYEIINMSGSQDPTESCDMLVNIWLAYRSSYQRLDVQLSDWICDYCLINRLRPPLEKLEKIGDSLLSGASLKEFYIDTGSPDEMYASLLMRYCSNYNYLKSKFAAGENRELYRRHMLGAVSHVISASQCPERPLTGTRMQDCRTVRDAYTGALCSPKIKKRIEIEYCSFSHSHELRFMVTDLMKFAENKLRAGLGIKSRLTHGALPPEIKHAAEEYFAAAFPQRQTPKNDMSKVPDYEKLYEPDHTPLSMEGAMKIENSSWETTEKLIDAFEDDEYVGAEEGSHVFPENGAPDDDVTAGEDSAAEPIGETEEENCIFNVPDHIVGTETDGDDLWDVLTDDERRFVCAAADGDRAAQSRIAAETGKPADVMADEINEKAADVFGDVILEDNGSGYAVIEDYAEQTAAWRKRGEEN